MTTCPKCGYVRKPLEQTPGWQCPSCHIAYAKYQPRPEAPKRSPRRMEDDRSYEGALARRERNLWHAFAVGAAVFGLIFATVAWREGGAGWTVFIFAPLYGFLAIHLFGFLGRRLRPYLRGDEDRWLRRVDRAHTEQLALQAGESTATERPLAGSELFRCRPLACLRHEAAASSAYLAFVHPFFLIPGGGMLAGGAILGVFVILLALVEPAVQVRDAARPLLVPLWVAGSALVAAWLVRGMLSKRHDHLVVHADGFAVRCGGAGRVVRFDDVAAIRFGADTVSEGGVREVHPGGGMSTATNHAQDMHVALRSGKTAVVKGLLLRFEPEDLERFFAHLERFHSALLAERPRVARDGRRYFFAIDTLRA